MLLNNSNISDAKLLDSIAVEEHLQVDVAILARLDSFSEEVVSGQVGVAHIVLNLLQEALFLHIV